MGLIIHRCQKCTHVQHNHQSRDCSYGWCRCVQPDYGPSEIMPTWTTEGHLVLGVEAPASRFFGFGKGYVDLCGCQECWAVYRAWELVSR